MSDLWATKLIDCSICGDPFAKPKRATRRRCNSCSSLMDAARAKAVAAVARAIKHGDLRPARDCTCVDCELPARDYEHRDYSQPLNVEPVCRRCNALRGPASLGIQIPSQFPVS